MGRKTTSLGQGSIYQRNGWWWCNYVAGGVRPCKTKIREEALAFLHRRQGKLASGEFLTPDRTRIRDLLQLLLEDYATSEQVKQYIQQRLKKVKPSTVNRELGILDRAFQLGYQQDPPLVWRVPYFPS